MLQSLQVNVLITVYQLQSISTYVFLMAMRNNVRK